uniref:Uncharacterized protein n=1 Tax=Triticum urartu TaxID=4572 RepID=A0A8R7V572_TRIUA
MAIVPSATHGEPRESGKMLLPNSRRFLARLLAVLTLLLLTFVGGHARGLGRSCDTFQNPTGCSSLPSPNCPECGRR